MFSPSVKSVPGTFVSIAPTGIGVPFALTPALVPHDDVLEAAWALTAPVLALLELLPIAATIKAPSAASTTTLNLTLMGAYLRILTSHPLLSSEREGTIQPRDGAGVCDQRHIGASL
jgi:hypothetical protein